MTLATMKDVAKLAGVSLSTTSYALNGSNKISDATRQKVLEAAKQLNFSPNAAARSLKTKKTKIIGVILMELFPQGFVSLFANDTQLIELSYQLLRIYIFGFIIMGAFSTFQQTYNALGCGKNAFFFAFFRKVILLIPLIYILPLILPSYGIFAVVLAEPISDLMTTIINGLYFKKFVKKTLI